MAQASHRHAVGEADQVGRGRSPAIRFITSVEVRRCTPGSAGHAPSDLRTGLGISGLNPKGLLVFLALLPQFADRANAWPLALQLAALGAVFTGTCTVFYLRLGSVAGARSCMPGPRWRM